MKKLLVFCLILCFLLVGCGEKRIVNCTLNSRLVQEDEVCQMLLQSDALFAFEVSKDEETTVQTVYVWDNLLRRELWDDVYLLWKHLSDEEKIITLEVGDEICIDGERIDFSYTSDTSRAVLTSVLPKLADVNLHDFKLQLRLWFIRLETYEALGDTEVIAIETRISDEEKMRLDFQSLNEIQLINDLNF
ncbi:MAG: hypothetical protein IJ489_02275 [Clostridia bacterium]|nr:hypothetical protein [Clostridia bacterium]